MTDVLYFQIGAWKPIVNKLSIDDEEEIYGVLGFKDWIDFGEKAKRYRDPRGTAWYAENGGLVLIEGYMWDTVIHDHGDWEEYKRALVFYRTVITKRLFEEAKRDPIRAIELAKAKV
ncbi:malic enzyme [Pyrococcus sp. NA2]|uniref:hypothetical protein n=1 Tax=Pyrococcus sp. (strain NA2) TaxID=342949 RepID=UPI000209ADFA|nr:hypothetical protein [Pyrococcus sp. NA2]AEC52246.1 malic enzyme [Pyrococcus sp. NA2]